jgi:predicted dinucleotide-binding enzyme
MRWRSPSSAPGTSAGRWPTPAPARATQSPFVPPPPSMPRPSLGRPAPPPSGSNRTAVQNAEVVVLAVHTPALDGVLGELGDALDGKVVIDVTNRLNPDDPGAVLDGSSNAEQIQARVPGARVVKAFNTALAARQADPVVDGVPLDGLVAGDDTAAKGQVLELVDSMGFRPIDAGPLSMARALEAMAVLNIMLQMWNGWPWQAGWKLVGPTA